MKILLSLLFLSFSLFSAYCFSPIDNHLINCGSAVYADVYNRRFISNDVSSNSNSPLLSVTRTISVVNRNSALNSPLIYHTARVFERPSKYVFQIKDAATHMVRLHFHPFASSNLDLNSARFHVLVNGFVVLNNFTVANVVSPLIKEYLIWIDSNELVITFMPTRKHEFGFVNAIEVISAPKDLITDLATRLNGNKTEKFDGLTRHALETMYRINVGGPKITPFNDSIWRTWVPDDGFFVPNGLSNTKYFGGRIMYRIGGASREVGPDFVYGTARMIRSNNASVLNTNMTWEFPVIKGYQYLVRLHFCDIASISLGLLYFNVYINEHLAYENFDITSATYMLASPIYTDFVIGSDSSEVVRVSIGPSNSSLGNAVDGILNGVEIMKMNNSMGSLDGNMCSGILMRSWSRENVGVLVPLIAAVCILFSISALMHKRTIGSRDSFVWSRLSSYAQEDALEHRNGHFSGKN